MSDTAEETTRDEEFDAFYARTNRRLTAHALMRFGRDRQGVEDALQEAYIEAMERWPTVRSCPSPEGWVLTTMRRKLARDGRRWRNRWKPAELTVPASPAATVEETSEALATLRALTTLPPRQREVIVMATSGMSYQEISTALGITTRGVGSNLHKARARLTLLLSIPPGSDREGERLMSLSPRDPLYAALSAADAWLLDGLCAEEREREPGRGPGHDSGRGHR
ncbi:RNA polymerase sigma factor [Streptomyces coffeae]|uniref:Sigma-70 family RNA polymerase sigma factor n=1 Tax=Streptomyces coffeae TaxID=621382 RepID=A0ABS1N5T5_9ACTN|nr:sigma-70 family RNA polymerase sigma factor [Streptomyces coffeae]MBL1095274.1 sigma-70 family RNA polymerase sigma factor [Streptomyces coffeae]